MSHLTRDERCVIAMRKLEGCSQVKIARELDRSPSTISRELKRNSKPRGSLRYHSYDPYHAVRKAEDRRKERPYLAKLERPEIYEAVVSKLEINWSPQQISGWLKLQQCKPVISHQTIYEYLSCLPKDHVHRQAMRRRGRRPRKESPGFIAKALKNRVSIHDRPKVVNQRKRIGDWELDLMTCHHTSGYLITAVERKTGYTLIRKVPSKHAGRVMKGILKMFESIPRSKLKTFTFDNGTEFYYHRRFTNDLGVKVYFADPYNSGQRGTNENTNGLIRQYFPKSRPYGTISLWDVRKVQAKLNHRPRLRLKYQTPAALFE